MKRIKADKKFQIRFIRPIRVQKMIKNSLEKNLFLYFLNAYVESFSDPRE